MLENSTAGERDFYKLGSSQPLPRNPKKIVEKSKKGSKFKGRLKLFQNSSVLMAVGFPNTGVSAALCMFDMLITFDIRDALKKNYGIIWEFFPI